MRAKSRTRALLTTVALLPVVGLGAAPMAGAAPAPKADDCAERMLFQVGGNGDQEAKVFDASNANLPAGVDFTKIHYSASIAPLPGNPISKDDSVAEGVANLKKEVDDFHAACPSSQITITGYSQGAIVAGDHLHALDQTNAIPHSQINGVLYSDSRRPGVNGGPGGVETNLPTILPGLTMNGPRHIENIPVKNICKKNDGICHSENPITNLLGFANGVAGYLGGDHSYDIAPAEESGGGDVLIDQPPRIPHGAPLPLPIPPPYEWLNNNPQAAQAKLAQFRKAINPLLSADQRDRLNEFPWLSVPTN